MKVIYAIPGLGTTGELFQHISVPGYALRILDWPQPQKDLDLPGYAARFLPQIDSSSPVNLMGVSFGGMICSELAEIIAVNKVILISSNQNRSEFPIALKLLKYLPVYRLVPDKLVRLLAKTKRKFLGFEESFEPVFFRMIDQMPQNYFTCCISYIIGWNRTSNNVPMVRIHGSSDKLLLHKKTGRGYTIQEGSHSMVLARAAEINVILNTELNGTTSTS